jgi:hypothetical protein
LSRGGYNRCHLATILAWVQTCKKERKNHLLFYGTQIFLHTETDFFKMTQWPGPFHVTVSFAFLMSVSDQEF